MHRLVIISGCSGGGKSTLLVELHRRGYDVIEEPGRRIVKEELATGGTALPWIDSVAFVRRAIAMALADRDAIATAGAGGEGWVFVDRGLIDAAAALEYLTGEPVLQTLGARHRYHQRVFLAPPWPEIYATDPERRHELDDALAEYERLLDVYPSLGYEVVVLPKVGVAERADFVLAMLVA
jgi:predicted ATPase